MEIRCTAHQIPKINKPNLMKVPMPLPLGKLSPELLEKFLTYLRDSPLDSQVVIGPKLGQDTAVVDIGNQYLVIKSDPITFATDKIGYYAISINANDIILSGARPQWFMCTLLIPESFSRDQVDEIFKDLGHYSKSLGITVIGGHTEVTGQINHPIVSGTMFGVVSKENLITTMGGKPGDALLLTQGIAIEGVAIICREKEADLKSKRVSISTIQQGQNLLLNPGICIVNDVRQILSEFNLHAMHDPTEGGLAMGAVELAENSQCGLYLVYNDIPIIFPTEEICQIYNLNPLGLISSGCALIAVDPADVDSILKYCTTKRIPITKIGHLTEKPQQYTIEMPDGNIEQLVYSTKDEITKIL